MKRASILQGICYALSILFLYAAIMKATDYGKFLLDISKSPLLANFSNKLIAPSVLTVECITALLLQFTATRKSGLCLSAFLMLLFSVYMFTLYFFYTNIPCSCGGILGRMSYPVHIVFNVLCTLIAFAGVLLQQKEENIARPV